MLTGESVPAPDAPGGFSWTDVRVGVLCNDASGQGGDSASRARRVIEALRSHGACAPDLDGLEPDIPGQMRALRDDPPGVVLAVGGDGTINAGARIAIAANAPLLIVPSGTMNLVAADLGIPLEIDRQLVDIARLVPRPIDYATVNGEVFLHSSAIGFVPHMARLREELRASETPRAWIRNAARFARGLFSVTRRHVRFRASGPDAEQTRAERRTRSVLVTCNPLANAGLGQHRRASVDSAVLAVYASSHTGPLASARLCLTFASGTFARDTDMDCGVCRELTIETRRPRVTVSNDGERATLSAPLRYAVLPDELRVLVAPESVPGHKGAARPNGSENTGDRAV